MSRVNLADYDVIFNIVFYHAGGRSGMFSFLIFSDKLVLGFSQNSIRSLANRLRFRVCMKGIICFSRKAIWLWSFSCQ